jgi:hypothetical protein
MCDIVTLMKTQLSKGIALASFVAVMSTPLHAQTTAPVDQPPEQPVTQELGYGVASALASVFYIPAKVTYAGLGLVTGGLGYVLTGGRTDVATNIIYPAVRGHYVVTPNHIKGIEPIYFVGAPPESPEPESYAAGTPGTTR